MNTEIDDLVKRDDRLRAMTEKAGSSVMGLPIARHRGVERMLANAADKRTGMAFDSTYGAAGWVPEVMQRNPFVRPVVAYRWA
ncbi:hypothetical protein, partial [Streptococcus pneumoniae]